MNVSYPKRECHSVYIFNTIISKSKKIKDKTGDILKLERIKLKLFLFRACNRIHKTVPS